MKKPKHKPSVEGAVGDVATAIIAKLRNEIFTSLSGLNAGILRALEAFNDKPFQKRFGSRNLIFENEEKPLLRALPMVSYEVCEWSYKHKVDNNSHIWWNKGQYSVPSRYIGQKVDVKYNNHLVYIYYNRTEIAKHQRLSSSVINGMRTDPNHLPFPLKKNLSVDDLKDAARDIGPATFELVRRMFDESKIVHQPVQTVKTILSIADQFTQEILDKACEKAMKQYHTPFYKVIYSHAKSINAAKELKDFRESNSKSGIVRGADYYKKWDTK